MKKHLILQMSWLFLLLAASSEGTFFEYPKKALTDFFQSLKDKKEANKKMLTNVHHFHLHYYPTPVEVDTKPFVPPDKTHLNQLHSESFRSLGWTDQEFPVPDPKIIFPSKMQDLWNDRNENSRKMWSWDNNIFETNPVQPQPVLVQVPFHQQIVIQQPAVKEEKKMNFLAAFFQKLRRISKALFQEEKPQEDCDDREGEAQITSKLNGLVVYVNSKKNQKV